MSIWRSIVVYIDILSPLPFVGHKLGQIDLKSHRGRRDHELDQALCSHRDILDHKQGQHKL